MVTFRRREKVEVEFIERGKGLIFFGLFSRRLWVTWRNFHVNYSIKIMEGYGLYMVSGSSGIMKLITQFLSLNLVRSIMKQLKFLS